MSFGDRFLAHPDLFPARLSGEPWGDRAVTISFAGSTYRFSGLSTVQADAVGARFGVLCATDPTGGAAAVNAELFRVPADEFLESDLALTPDPVYTVDRDYGADNLRLVNHHFMGRLDWRHGLRAALWTADEDNLVEDRGFENFFRILAAYRLLAVGGVLLHSAGIVMGGKAYVFPGHSNAGKSTVSRLAQAAGYEVLSDDMNALAVRDGTVWVERLPFSGELGQTQPPSSDSFPLGGLFRLRKGDTSAVSALSQAQAYAGLYANAPFVNADPFRERLLGRNLAEILSRFEARLLTFSRDGGFWDLLEDRS